MLLLLLSRFRRVRPCGTPETAAHQAPPSTGFSWQGCWSGLPFSSPKEYVRQIQKIKQTSLILQYFEKRQVEQYKSWHTGWHRAHRWEELLTGGCGRAEDRQQQETEGELHLHSLPMLMGCTFPSLKACGLKVCM